MKHTFKLERLDGAQISAAPLRPWPAADENVDLSNLRQHRPRAWGFCERMSPFRHAPSRRGGRCRADSWPGRACASPPPPSPHERPAPCRDLVSREARRRRRRGRRARSRDRPCRRRSDHHVQGRWHRSGCVVEPPFEIPIPTFYEDRNAVPAAVDVREVGLTVAVEIRDRDRIGATGRREVAPGLEPAEFPAAEASASGAVEEAAKVGALHGDHDPESGGGGTKGFRPVPTLGALAHHLEKVAQSLAVDVDLDVVAQRGGRVVEGDVDFAELGAEVLR